MKNAVRSLYAQIVYMLGMGIGFLFMPDTILPLFGFATTSEVWIRVLGALVIVFSSYYYMGARFELVPFMKASVWGRYVFIASLIVFAAIGWAGTMFYVFAIVEGALAAWTHVSLKQDKLM